MQYPDDLCFDTIIFLIGCLCLCFHRELVPSMWPSSTASSLYTCTILYILNWSDYFVFHELCILLTNNLLKLLFTWSCEIKMKWNEMKSSGLLQGHLFSIHRDNPKPLSSHCHFYKYHIWARRLNDPPNSDSRCRTAGWNAQQWGIDIKLHIVIV